MGDQFLPNDEQEAEDQLRKNLKFKKVRVETDSSALWDRIRKDIQQDTPVRSIRTARRNRLYWLSAAATILLVLAFFFLWPSGMEEYQTQMAETIELSLPDQSSVVVNANSELRYNAENWSEERKVTLRGEAFFQVEKGQRFTVATERGEVEVLGTAFNVYARNESFRVSCQEGRVAVRSTSGQETILEAGDVATLIDGEWKRAEVRTADIASWRNGLFVYEGESVAFILDELMRQYGVDIRYPENISEEALTMRFDRNQSLAESLEPILFSYRLSIKRDGQNVVLE